MHKSFDCAPIQKYWQSVNKQTVLHERAEDQTQF